MPMKPATNKASRKGEVEWIEYPAYVNRGWAPTSSRTTAGEDYPTCGRWPEARTPA